MNFSANMLGLDNAATPLGLKAMQDLQNENPEKNVASDAQIMFLVINTSGLTIIPVSILAQRAILGAASPADIFIPALLATAISTLAGVIAVALRQRINLLSSTFGVLDWIPGKNRRGGGDYDNYNGGYGVISAPVGGTTFALHAYKQRTDTLASNGIRQDDVREFEVSIDISANLAPLSSVDETASRIRKIST
jgi:hypothetical protein